MDTSDLDVPMLLSSTYEQEQKLHKLLYYLITLSTSFQSPLASSAS